MSSSSVFRSSCPAPSFELGSNAAGAHLSRVVPACHPKATALPASKPNFFCHLPSAPFNVHPCKIDATARTAFHSLVRQLHDVPHHIESAPPSSCWCFLTSREAVIFQHLSRTCHTAHGIRLWDTASPPRNPSRRPVTRRRDVVDVLESELDVQH